MDGDVAPLDKVYAVTAAHGVMLMVDDAHGEGVLGHGGRGIVDHFHLHGKVDIEVGTLSKAFGVVGGVSPEVHWWWNGCASAGGLSCSPLPCPRRMRLPAWLPLDLLEESTELVDRLWENTRYFKQEMKTWDSTRAIRPPRSPPSCWAKHPWRSSSAVRVFEEGVFAMALGFPTVPRGKARIRVMISAAHTHDDLDKGLEIFTRVGRSLGVIS